MKQTLLSKKTLITLLASLALPLSVFAEPAPEHNEASHCNRHTSAEHHGEHRSMPSFATGIPPFLKELQLTESQEDSIFKLMHSQLPAIRDLEKARRQAMNELRELANANSFDESKAQKLAERLGALEKDAVLSRTRNESKIYSLLTPEQRQKLADIKSRFKEGRSEEPVNFQYRKHEHGFYRNS